MSTDKLWKSDIVTVQGCKLQVFFLVDSEFPKIWINSNQMPKETYLVFFSFVVKLSKTAEVNFDKMVRNIYYKFFDSQQKLASC